MKHWEVMMIIQSQKVLRPSENSVFGPTFDLQHVSKDKLGCVWVWQILFKSDYFFRAEKMTFLTIIITIIVLAFQYWCAVWRREAAALAAVQAAGLSCTCHTQMWQMSAELYWRHAAALLSSRFECSGLWVFFLVVVVFWLGLFISFLQTMNGCSLSFYLPPT